MSKSLETSSTKKKGKIGIVMPISQTEGYDKNHWNDVKHILEDVVTELEYEKPEMVSQSHGSIIQETIITNLYENELVICDVSSNNPNVLFELGIRIAFDKPVVIVIDDKTKFNFDYGPIMHVTYNSSLAYVGVNKFKDSLKKTILKQIDQPSSYLSIFGGKIKSTKLEEKETSVFDVLRSEIKSLSNKIDGINNYSEANPNNQNGYFNSTEYNDLLNTFFDYDLFENYEIKRGDLFTGSLKMIKLIGDLESTYNIPIFKSMGTLTKEKVLINIYDFVMDNKLF
ncbi:hypothetical protein [Lishizhenia sp.]|uniref:hypothetical protein n=1 Tax=Lishizhenia sp. TaxID=2497594 RepID=UPI00299EC069|nr:hypothetical protein [Lishizhenia sp.]MDX1446618.1 hypothetical protein [Lishizhenia sp.]